MPAETRSFTDILQDVVSRAEITIEAKEAARASSVFAVGVILGLYCLGFLFLAAVYALSTVLPSWGAALIVFGGLLIIAAILMAVGRSRMKLVRAKRNYHPER